MSLPFTARFEPLPRWAKIAWTFFYVLVLYLAATSDDHYLFIDNANLVVHEAGHALFGWCGVLLGVWGGSLLQWLVPLALAAWFAWQRQAAGFIFSMFFFFENLLYSSWYMADARTMALDLVTIGDPEGAIHDWNFIFSHLGVLPLDTRIAAAVRLVAWVGMIASIGYLWALRRVSESGADAATSGS